MVPCFSLKTRQLQIGATAVAVAEGGGFKGLIHTNNVTGGSKERPRTLAVSCDDNDTGKQPVLLFLLGWVEFCEDLRNQMKCVIQ